MRITRLPTVHTLAATRCHRRGANDKFEQVSGDGHQISRAEVGTHILCLEGAGAGGGFLYGEVQTIMGNSHRGAPSCGQND